MLQFICLFFPTFFAMKKESKSIEKNKILNMVCMYGMYNLLINLIVLIFIAIKNNFTVLLLNYEKFTVTFTIKYLILAISIAYFLPYVIQFFKKNLEIEVKVELLEGEKNEKNKGEENKYSN